MQSLLFALFFLIPFFLPNSVFAESHLGLSGDQPVKVYFMLSVDWEGDTLRSSNLKAMQEFNKKFPQYPVIHFLNAAYYTKSWANSDKTITQKIKSVIKPIDELGLHIHSWKNFVEAAGVKFRHGPSFWNSAHSIARNGEPGDDVPINEYSVEEIRKMIRYSIQKLKEQGFKHLRSFRGGGWMSGSKVQEALKAEGLKIDSSAVPVELVEKLYPDTLLAQINKKQWKGISSLSQPFIQANRTLQFPNNMGLADYVDEQEFRRQFAKVRTAAGHAKEIYLHFGWHQESAVEYFEHGTKNGEMNLKQSYYLERVVNVVRWLEGLHRAGEISLVPIGFSSYQKASKNWKAQKSFSCRRAVRGL